jgi:DNA-directed RNA polymerase specialized sigma24 family protein
MIRHEPSRVTGMQIFDRHRLLLFSMAYRMLGSVMDAEDIVQEAYLRWRGTGEEVRSPKAYLSTVVTRLAIDELRSAQARREHYVGPWLPEPLATGGASGVAESPIMAESLSMAFQTRRNTSSASRAGPRRRFLWSGAATDGNLPDHAQSTNKKKGVELP